MLWQYLYLDDGFDGVKIAFLLQSVAQVMEKEVIGFCFEFVVECVVKTCLFCPVQRVS